MMSCEKGKFPYSFFILLTQWYKFPASKLTNFHIFIIHLPLNVTLFSKSRYLTVHIKINYAPLCIGRFSGKHRDVFTNIAIEFIPALVSSFQPLTNFT